MKLHNIYFGNVNYEEKQSGKERPVVVVNVDDKNADGTYVFGIYTYRKWFKSLENVKRYHEITDLRSAGLNRRCFVDVARAINVEAVAIHKYKHLGALSESDSDALIAKMKEYERLA
ncbi:MAG: hypothetical protein LBL41_04180 [Bifidobacteriaceae bacterium]|nr:hypothetical protein [Bifidobacteriaceae bacterium]